MFRFLAVFAALASLLVVAGGASGRSQPQIAHLFVRVPLPRFGDMLVARIVVRARPGIGVSVRLRLRALNADSLPPWITAIGGVVGLHRRPFKYVSVVTVVNRHPPGPLQPGEPRPRYARFIAVELVAAKGTTVAEAKHYFRVHKRIAGDLLGRFGQGGTELPDLFQPVDADAETPMQRALQERGRLTFPLAGWPVPAVQRAGAGSETDPGTVLNDVSDVALAACDQDPTHTEEAKKRVEGDLATTLANVSTNPTSQKKCGLTRYSFKGLKVTYSAAGKSYAFSNIAGSVCGDPLKTPWSVSFASTGEANRTVSVNFSSANPATLETRRFSGGSIALKLQYSTDASAVAKASATPTGKVTKVAVTPAQAAVAAAAAQSC